MLSKRIILGLWVILGALLLIYSSQLLNERMRGIAACLQTHPNAAIFYLDDGDAKSVLLDKGQLVIVDTPREEPLQVPGYPDKPVIVAPYLDHYDFGPTFILTEYGQWWGCMFMVLGSMCLFMSLKRQPLEPIPPQSPLAPSL